MALYNLVRVKTATTGTADVVTGLAVSGYLTLALGGVPDGAVVTYGLQDLDVSGIVLASEVGRGTWNAGTLTLARTTVIDSTNGGAKISLTGNAEIFITAIAQDFTPTAIGAQPVDATLTSIALLGTAADRMIYTTAIDTWAETPLTSFARTILDDANAAAALATIGAQSALTFPLGSTLGGTGVNNAGTLTNASNTTITGGGTLALGGFTLTVPATGTAALLATANVFTAAQKINVNSTTAFFVEQDGVKDNVFLVDTTNGRVGIGGAPIDSLQVYGDETNGTTRLYDYGTINYVPLNIGGNLRFVRVETNAVGAGHSQADGTVNNSGNYKIQAYSNSAWIDVIGLSYNGMNTYSLITAPFGLRVNGNADVGIYLSDNNAVYEFKLYNNNRVLTLKGDHTNSTSPTWPRTLLTVDNVSGQTTHFGLSTTTNAPIETVKLQAQVSTSSTGGANGFGVSQGFYAETATDLTYQQQGLVSTSWIDATNASRKAKMSLSAYDTAARLGIEIEASGSAAMLGFFGAATVVRQGATTDLGVALSNLGLRAAGTAYPITTSGAVTLGSLTAGRVTFAGTAGLLSDDADMTFATDTLTVTKIVGSTSVKVGAVAGYISSDGSTGATGSFTTADLKTVTVKDGIITSIV